ncbi:MAG: PaaI family thioesterase [Sphingobium sp.]
MNDEWAGFQRRETEPARNTFAPLPDTDGFVDQVGPYHICLDEGLVRLAFEVEPRHCNPNGACHGGALATLLDTELAVAGRVQARVVDRFLLTISLSIDYVGAPLIGDWVVTRADVVRRTRNMVFMHGVASCRGVVLARASGVFRLGPDIPTDNAISRMAREAGLA